MILTRRARWSAGGAGGRCWRGATASPNWAPTRKILSSGETINRGLQRALIDRGALAPEFRPDQMSPVFRVNGTAQPEHARI